MLKPIMITALLGMALLSACAKMPSVSEQNDAVQTFKIEAKTIPCPTKVEQRCLMVNGAAFSGVIEGYTHTEGQDTVIVVARTHRKTLQQTGSSSYNYRIISRWPRP